MKVIDLLSSDDRVAAVLAKHGLPCASCIVAEKETLEEGCRPLGLDPTPIIAELNTLPPR
jgi:hybrid cluster-associated redox disulfide protein